MRKWSIILTVGVALVLVLSVAACGQGSQAALGANSDSPEEVLAATFAASDDVTQASGGFDISMTIDADLSQIPADAMQFAEPLAKHGITLSGTFASGADPVAADCSVSGTVMGYPLDVGMKLTDDGLWLAYAGQWYALPAEAMQGYEEYVTQIDSQEVEQLLADLGLDPVTWIKDLRIVGSETVAGVETVHVTGSPDVMKMVNDGMELMRSEEFLALIDPEGTFTNGMLSGQLPSPSEVEEIRPMMEAIFAGTTIDLWVGKADAMPRKVAVQGHMTPPPDEDTEGLLGVDFSVSVWLDSINQPVTVVAPASSLPFMELMNAVEADPGIFGLFEGMPGGGPLFY